MLMRVPQGCGVLTGRVTCLKCSLYGLSQVSRHYHRQLVRARLKGVVLSSASLMRVIQIIKTGSVPIDAAAHVDDIYAVGLKEKR